MHIKMLDMLPSLTKGKIQEWFSLYYEERKKMCKKCWYIYSRKVAHSCADISIVPLVPVVEFVSSIWIVDTWLGGRRVGRGKDRVARLVAVSFTINLTMELIQSLIIYKWQTGIGTWTRLGTQGNSFWCPEETDILHKREKRKIHTSWRSKDVQWKLT